MLLERWVNAHGTPQSVAARAWIVLMGSDGVSNSAIARELGVSRPTVIMWRERFRVDGPQALWEVKPGRGRKRTISAEKVKEIVQATTQTTPPGETHWSCRSMAKAQGVSPATVQRIWDAHGLKPHLIKTFKLSNDPLFTEKLTGRRRAVFESAREGAGAVCGREESNPSTRSHTSLAADEEGQGRHDDP